MGTHRKTVEKAENGASSPEIFTKPTGGWPFRDHQPNDGGVGICGPSTEECRDDGVKGMEWRVAPDHVSGKLSPVLLYGAKSGKPTGTTLLNVGPVFFGACVDGSGGGVEL